MRERVSEAGDSPNSKTEVSSALLIQHYLRVLWYSSARWGRYSCSQCRSLETDWRRVVRQ